MRLVLGLLAAASISQPFLNAKEPKNRLAEVSANAELTEEGKKIPRPTPDRPVYYVPITYGWHEEGGLIAGEEPPKRADVLRQLGLALEGYVLQALPPDANSTLPSLIIAVEWGYSEPVGLMHAAANPRAGRLCFRFPVKPGFRFPAPCPRSKDLFVPGPVAAG